MSPPISIHGFIDLLEGTAANAHHTPVWLRISRRLVLAACLSVTLTAGLAWLVTEAPPSPYEIVATWASH